MILEGTTSEGAVVPVQVTDDGKVVAEGLTGPQGPEGPEGPEGPQGPPGPDSPVWDRSGAVVSPTNAGDTISLNANTNNPILLENQNGSAADASISTFSATNGTLVSLGSNSFFNTDGAEARFDATAPAAAITLNRTGRVTIGTSDGTQNAQERVRIEANGVLTIGGATPAVSLEPGSTGVPLVRDSLGRLLVGMANAPSGTLAGDVVCQGAVVLQSPNGMWWALEVADDGTLSIAQTAIR